LYEEAIDANPSEPLAWLFTATRCAYLGEGREAEAAGERALRLSPIDPLKYFFDSLAATAALSNSNWERSVALSQRSLKANRTHASTWRTLAFALVMLNRMDEARVAVQRLLLIEPGFTVGRFLERFPGRDGPLAQPWAEALKAADLPD
jgi:tetratricopeptide (TPR) repeat protein